MNIVVQNVDQFLRVDIVKDARFHDTMKVTITCAYFAKTNDAITLFYC